MEKPPRAQNEVGMAVRSLAGLRALVSAAMLIHQLIVRVVSEGTAHLDWQPLLSLEFSVGPECSCRCSRFFATGLVHAAPGIRSRDRRPEVESPLAVRIAAATGAER